MANYVLEQEFYDFLINEPKISQVTANDYAHNYLRKRWEHLNNYPFEKDFLEVIPYLLSLGEFEKCTQVLLRVYRVVQIEAYSGEKPLKNFRSAFNKYAKFIQRKYIDKHKKIVLPSIFTSLYTLQIITNALNNGIVYYYVKGGDIISANRLKLSINDKSKYNLCKILNSRLGSQNRTSGNKTWLSLDLISKIVPAVFKNYVYTINENTYIHAIDNNCHHVSIQCKDIWCLYLYKTSGQTNYSIKVTTKKNKTYDVLTPTATLGQKALMQVADISKVVIDHVKPIDQTLRELETQHKIPELVKLSDAYKKAKNKLVTKKGEKIKDSVIANEAKLQLGSRVNTTNLQREMDLLLNDSWYRLMDSKNNSAKSNDNTFYEFRTNYDSNPSPSTIIGLIMSANHSTYRQVMIVYQKLSNPGINYVNSASYVNSTYPVQIDLTSFISDCGPKIL